MTPFSEAADSILRGDQACSKEFGGKRFDRVDSVECNDALGFPQVILHLGEELRAAPIMPVGIYRPADRALAPVDVHDAVFNAMVAAALG